MLSCFSSVNNRYPEAVHPRGLAEGAPLSIILVSLGIVKVLSMKRNMITDDHKQPVALAWGVVVFPDRELQN